MPSLIRNGDLERNGTFRAPAPARKISCYGNISFSCLCPRGFGFWKGGPRGRGDGGPSAPVYITGPAAFLWGTRRLDALRRCCRVGIWWINGTHMKSSPNIR